MTRPLALLVAAAAIYEALAVRFHRTPTITHIVHQLRLHFRPACPTCGLVPHATNRRTSWHTARPR